MGVGFQINVLLKAGGVARYRYGSCGMVVALCIYVTGWLCAGSAPSLIMFAVGFLKPDDIEKWLDKTIAFGRGGQEAFDSIEAQIEAMKAIGNDNTTQAG